MHGLNHVNPQEQKKHVVLLFSLKIAHPASGLHYLKAQVHILGLRGLLKEHVISSHHLGILGGMQPQSSHAQVLSIDRKQSMPGVGQGRSGGRMSRTSCSCWASLTRKRATERSKLSWSTRLLTCDTAALLKAWSLNSKKRRGVLHSNKCTHL